MNKNKKAISNSDYINPKQRKSSRPTGASFEGGWRAVAPPPPRKKKKRKKKRKKGEKREKKERKKGTMNNVKLLHIKCCFFLIFNNPVALKNNKKIWPPKKKLKWRPCRPIHPPMNRPINRPITRPLNRPINRPTYYLPTCDEPTYKWPWSFEKCFQAYVFILSAITSWIQINLISRMIERSVCPTNCWHISVNITIKNRIVYQEL